MLHCIAVNHNGCGKADLRYKARASLSMLRFWEHPFRTGAYALGGIQTNRNLTSIVVNNAIIVYLITNHNSAQVLQAVPVHLFSLTSKPNC